MTSSQARTPLRAVPPAKLGWIAGLVVATLIPDLLVARLVGERQDRAGAVDAAVAGAWGPPQAVAGPVLSWSPSDKGGEPHRVALAPRTLDLRATIVPGTRRRGPYEATVYEASVAMSGSFALPAGARADIARAQAAGAETLLAVAVPGLQGLRDDDRVEIAGGKVPWQPCAEVLGADDAACRGGPVLVAALDLAEAKPDGSDTDALPFALTLHLRGTASLRVATAAKTAAIRIAGAWPTPGFVGGELPAASSVKDGGFSAEWAVHRAGRPAYRGVSTLAQASAQMSAQASAGDAAAPVGVELVEEAPVYRMISRVEKYGLVIVVLAFAAYFAFEMMTGAVIGLLQYALLGAALTLFTLLLLSIGEVLGYGLGYGASALLITAQASLYTGSVTRRGRLAWVFAALLGGVFGFFYVLVGLESYALLVGAAALFVVVSLVMGLTQAARPLPGAAG